MEITMRTLAELMVYIDELASDKEVNINSNELKSLIEDRDSSIINDMELYIDYVATLAERLETSYKNASKLVTEDIMEEVITEMYQAEVDHINFNIERYERGLC